ncbi:MAG: hypothetical protein IJ194_01205 [Bacilli bacterium]|nr:hypothetical protein [Bacilli bacterium]
MTAINGDKKIEDIKVGDKVLSKNPETGEIAYKRVTKLYRNETHAWVTIHLGKKHEITCTLLHIFFVSGIGKRNAFTLKQGSQLFDKDGNKITVTWVDIKRTKHSETTYNIEVEDFHTYFVSGLGIWVSNICVFKKNGVEVRVNTNSERESPHAHILLDGKRVEEIDENGDIVFSKGNKIGNIKN